MTVSEADIEAIEQRLRDIAVRLEVAQTMAVTIAAHTLRIAGRHHQEVLGELRRNILAAMGNLYPAADTMAVLAREEGTDRLLDEVARLSKRDC